MSLRQQGEPERCGDRCDSFSPESDVRCDLPKGHDGAHEHRRGPYALTSWATERQADTMRQTLGWK